MNVTVQAIVYLVVKLPHAKVGVPYTDFTYCISQYIISTWQGDWNGAVANKLHSVKPVLGDWQSWYRQCWMDEIVLCHAHISHTYLMHSYILKKDPPPQCGVQSKRKYIFVGRDVMKSFRFHPTLILTLLDIFTSHLLSFTHFGT